MADTNFVDKTTVVPTEWLNEVNTLLWEVFTGATTAEEARTAIGLVLGTDVMAYDATLTSLASLGTAADRMAYTTGVDTWTETVITAVGRSILDDNTVGDVRTTLGLGSIATQASDNVTITGGSVTGITDLTVADGGTGVSSLTQYGVLVGAGSGAVQVTAAGTAGQVLTSNGTSNPTFQDASGGGANYCDGDYPNYSSVLSWISLLTAGGAWESFGPTGSGADNIWTALDSVPSDATWVELDVQWVITANSSGNASVKLYACSAAVVSPVAGYTTEILNMYTTVDDQETVRLKAKVPVDSSQRFQMHYTNTNVLAHTTLIMLTGFNGTPA